MNFLKVPLHPHEILRQKFKKETVEFVKKTLLYHRERFKREPKKVKQELKLELIKSETEVEFLIQKIGCKVRQKNQ